MPVSVTIVWKTVGEVIAVDAMQVHHGGRIEEWVLGRILRRGDDQARRIFARRQIVREVDDDRPALAGKNRWSRNQSVVSPDRRPEPWNDLGLTAHLGDLVNIRGRVWNRIQRRWYRQRLDERRSLRAVVEAGIDPVAEQIGAAHVNRGPDRF